MSLAMKTEPGKTPPFTDRQTAAIRTIARRRGIREDERKDFVHAVWVAVHESGARVPTGEPDRSRYIHGIAANLAAEWMQERAKDVLYNAVPFERLPPGTSAREQPTREESVLARQAAAAARARDPQGAAWMIRAVLDDEPATEIAAEEGVPVDRVRKRIHRLLAYLRTNLSMLSLLLMTLMSTIAALLPGRRPALPAVPEIAESAAPEGPSPARRAGALRAQAFGACDALRWSECGALLDEAAALDPEGEGAPRVREARAALAEATREPPGPTRGGTKPGTR